MPDGDDQRVHAWIVQGGDLLFIKGACEQIGDLEFIGPGAQISEVEIAADFFRAPRNIRRPGAP
ncbi:MAG: hypothetical protein IPM84_24985 [Anaerolineae bacterium]|nr:hypothetical protein [Anaerolineae bacterium]